MDSARSRFHSRSRVANNDSHAYYSAAPSTTVGHQESFAQAQGWRGRGFVEDSEASEEDSETEELPERQTEDHSYLPQEVLNDSFEFASTRPIFDNSQFEFQDRLTSTVPPVDSPGRQSQYQQFNEFGVATQRLYLLGNEPIYLKGPPTKSLRLDWLNVTNRNPNLVSPRISIRKIALPTSPRLSKPF